MAGLKFLRSACSTQEKSKNVSSRLASNVIEKCVAFASSVSRAALIESVLQVEANGVAPLVPMMKDQYANYVIQKMLDVVDESQRSLLVHAIQPHLDALRKYSYGKHIIAKVEKVLHRSRSRR